MGGVTAAILAGGLGTRLRPAVADRPKVLASVAGRPFLAHLLDQLADGGVEEVVLLVGHGADQVRKTFDGQFNGLRLHYSTEPAPLGTGGAVRLALPHLTADRVLLLNGDSYCDFDLPSLLTADGEVNMMLADVPDTARYGRVEVADGRVTGFAEKGGGGPGRINAGVYLFPTDLLAELPADRPLSFEREVLPGWVERGLVRPFPGGRFIDIGTPESYAEADRFFD